MIPRVKIKQFASYVHKNKRILKQKKLRTTKELNCFTCKDEIKYFKKLILKFILNYKKLTLLELNHSVNEVTVGYKNSRKGPDTTQFREYSVKLIIIFLLNCFKEEIPVDTPKIYA